MIDRQQVGRWGERVVVRMLEDRGYRILARNFASTAGEIDIIALDGRVLVFVEVRTRGPTALADPVETVDRRKRQRIVRAARFFLHRYQRRISFSSCRFDVAAVQYNPEARRARVTFYRNAFDIRGGL